MASGTQGAQSGSTGHETADPPETLVVDLGKASKKAVKRLRRGEGKLLQKVSRALSDMRTEGLIDAKAQPVIVVVKEKAKKQNPFFGG